jgi:hypothetical protein
MKNQIYSGTITHGRRKRTQPNGHIKEKFTIENQVPCQSSFSCTKKKGWMAEEGLSYVSIMYGMGDPVVLKKRCNLLVLDMFKSLVTENTTYAWQETKLTQ